MARGLIAGALGGLAQGASEIAGGHIKNELEVDLRKQLSAIEEQRQMRIAEAAEARRRAGRQADFDQDLANKPRATEAEIAALERTGPVKSRLAAEEEKARTIARGAAERENLGAYGTDAGARAGARAKAADTEHPGAAAERGLRLEEIKLRIAELKATTEEKAEMRDLLRQAAELKAGGNDDAAQQIIDTLRVRTGVDAKKGEKSYSDVVGAARVLTKAAEDAEMDDPALAKQYRRRAAELVEGVSEKRGVTAKPAAGAPPYPEGQRLKGKDGQIYVVRNGKPVLENARRAQGTVTQE